MAVFGGEKNPIGLAIVGCGRVGRIRARCAREYPGTEWLGCCDIDEKKGRAMAEEFGADFFTTDFAELIRRPEVNAVIIATDEEWHAKPLWESVEQGHKILVEKPLATSVVESAKIVEAAEAAGRLPDARGALPVPLQGGPVADGTPEWRTASADTACAWAARRAWPPPGPPWSRCNSPGAGPRPSCRGATRRDNSRNWAPWRGCATACEREEKRRLRREARPLRREREHHRKQAARGRIFGGELHHGPTGARRDARES